jgi:hypothetical protein
LLSLPHRPARGKLKSRPVEAHPTILQPTIRDVFFGEIGTVRFTRDSKQRISGFVLNGDRVRHFQFQKMADY